MNLSLIISIKFFGKEIAYQTTSLLTRLHFAILATHILLNPKYLLTIGKSTLQG